jgi:osmoprotectant transport system permease protein
MDSTLLYAAVENGDVDVISAFSTDGRIAAFDLTLLEDTRGALPPYDAVLLVSPRLRERRPEALEILVRLDGAIDAEAMREANRLVDLDGGSVADAERSLTETMTRN